MKKWEKEEMEEIISVFSKMVNLPVGYKESKAIRRAWNKTQLNKLEIKKGQKEALEKKDKEIEKLKSEYLELKDRFDDNFLFLRAIVESVDEKVRDGCYWLKEKFRDVSYWIRNQGNENKWMNECGSCKGKLIWLNKGKFYKKRKVCPNCLMEIVEESLRTVQTKKE